jgi:hypothetical protein
MNAITDLLPPRKAEDAALAADCITRRPVMAWHIDTETNRPVASWTVPTTQRHVDP